MASQFRRATQNPRNVPGSRLRLRTGKQRRAQHSSIATACDKIKTSKLTHDMALTRLTVSTSGMFRWLRKVAMTTGSLAFFSWWNSALVLLTSSTCERLLTAALGIFPTDGVWWKSINSDAPASGAGCSMTWFIRWQIYPVMIDYPFSHFVDSAGHRVLWSSIKLACGQYGGLTNVQKVLQKGNHQKNQIHWNSTAVGNFKAWSSWWPSLSVSISSSLPS